MQRSPTENVALHSATNGYIGLTGFIMWVDLQLMPIGGPVVETDKVVLHGLDEGFAVGEASASRPSTVAWIDSPMTAGRPMPRALVASAAQVGSVLVDALDGRTSDVVYAPAWWRLIMAGIRSVPEPLFKRLKL